MPVDLVKKYFPDLHPQKYAMFDTMADLYRLWNARINVISRKDTGNIMERHILHSLAIQKVHTFKSGDKIIDVGTGGGFPGIPLALMNEDCHFTLIDSIGKKIKVVNEIARELGLSNVKGIQARSEEFKGNFDYVISRAVTNLPSFYQQTRHLVKSGKAILYLKGGDFEDEVKQIKKKIRQYSLSDHFNEEFFETKKVVRIFMSS